MRLPLRRKRRDEDALRAKAIALLDASMEAAERAEDALRRGAPTDCAEVRAWRSLTLQLHRVLLAYIGIEGP